MKKIILTVAICTAFLHGCRTSEKYACMGRVTDIDTNADTVSFIDAYGEQWTFYGSDDWMIGDGIAAVMDDNGTDTRIDDIIINARYINWEDCYYDRI